MVCVDFSIFHTGGTYGYALGCVDIAVPTSRGASIDLAEVALLPMPPFFNGQIVVESIVQIERVGDLYACADVRVASLEEAQVLGAWLEHLPGLMVRTNEPDDPWWDDCV